MIYEDPYLINNCIIAENRKKRPEIGKDSLLCPFCPGHEGDIEEVILEVKDETGAFLTRIVNNKYPICGIHHETYGRHDVVIDTPDHQQHPKDFSEEHWNVLLKLIQERWQQIADDGQIAFIQVFKNYGTLAGASISHSHWQIVALDEIPYYVQLQYEHFSQFNKTQQQCYMCYLIETMDQSLIICEDENWIAAAPKVSEYAHETWLIPKKHHKVYGYLSSFELNSCGQMLKKLLAAYEVLEKGYAFNICFMSGGIKNSLDYHFFIKIIPRVTNWAGFELSTHCYFNTVHPITHAQVMKNILKK